MDLMVILTQMMYEMKTQREVDQRRCCHKEPMQFEADGRSEEARQCKGELKALLDELAARVAAIIALIWGIGASV
jgi:hypothetical protein